MSLLSVPLKTILPFWATSTNQTLPDSFVACEGQTLAIGTHDIGGGAAAYTVPEMRNRQPLGADRTKAFQVAGTVGDTAGDAPGPDGVGGRHAISLTVTELPSHSHTGGSDSQGGHTHAISTNSAGGHNHSDADYVFSGGVDVSLRGGGGVQITCTTGSTASAGGHNHTFGFGTDTSHYASHTITCSDPTGAAGAGSGAAFGSIPRYGAVIYIMKVKL